MWYRDMSDKQNEVRVELTRRKALAELHITKSIDKNVSLVPNSKSRKQYQNQEPDKESLGMILLGAMLTLTSIVLVSLCFITTMNSYDRAVNEEDIAPAIIANDNNGGPLISYPYPSMNRMNNTHFRRWRIMIRGQKIRM